jgi:hypothetical protein
MATAIPANFYPPNPFSSDAIMQTSVKGVTCKQGSVAHLQWAGAVAVAKGTANVHAAVADNGTQQTITTGFTNPAVPRNLRITWAATTNTDIKGGVQVYVEGTDWADQPINETSPVSTANTAGTVEMSKAFKTVTKAIIPAHNGTSVTTAIGWGDKLGLPYALPYGTALIAQRNYSREGTLPTIAFDANVLSNNTALFNSVPNGTDLDLWLLI